MLLFRCAHAELLCSIWELLDVAPERSHGVGQFNQILVFVRQVTSKASKANNALATEQSIEHVDKLKHDSK
jgi:hypothetical protein